MMKERHFLFSKESDCLTDFSLSSLSPKSTRRRYHFMQREREQQASHRIAQQLYKHTLTPPKIGPKYINKCH
jgi:hypothetical protein